MRPTCVQLELTYSCNNACPFCYNRLGSASQLSHTGELCFDELKAVIADLAEYGVFSINFNGGEPLAREEIYVLAEYAVEKGLDVHLNTNATMVTEQNASRIAKCFKAICTSLHGHEPGLHDQLVGRRGGFDDALRGMNLIRDYGVYVAVNVVLSRRNVTSFGKIVDFLRMQDVRTILVTRVLTHDSSFSISDREFLSAISSLRQYEKENGAFARVAFPQPIRLCTCDDQSLHAYIAERNIACAAGCLVARISPSGFVTPCPVMDTPCFGNVKDEPFSLIWGRVERMGWIRPLPLGERCEGCSDLSRCGGGCIPQEDGILQ